MTQTTDPQHITELLLKATKGNRVAADQLIDAVYDELRQRAKYYLNREHHPDHTLQPTALVHEAYLRLIKQDQVVWQNRTHFFAMASEMMRRILVDYARTQQAEKRGGEAIRLALDAALDLAVPQPDINLIVLDDALTELSELDPRQAKLVELRYFGGLSVEETAEVMQLSVATVMREWKITKMWLYRKLGG
jgi:RNA polymerase sigma factor (TIGR02999 family)